MRFEHLVLCKKLISGAVVCFITRICQVSFCWKLFFSLVWMNTGCLWNVLEIKFQGKSKDWAIPLIILAPVPLSTKLLPSYNILFAVTYSLRRWLGRCFSRFLHCPSFCSSQKPSIYYRGHSGTLIGEMNLEPHMYVKEWCRILDSKGLMS